LFSWFIATFDTLNYVCHIFKAIQSIATTEFNKSCDAKNHKNKYFLDVPGFPDTLNKLNYYIQQQTNW